MLQIIEGPIIYELNVSGPFMLPFRDDKFLEDKPFFEDPFWINAGCTSGSPMVVFRDGIMGFTQAQRGGKFSWDGKKLKAMIPKGQRLAKGIEADPRLLAREYVELVTGGAPVRKAENEQEFWSRIEYCTWCEQKTRPQQGNAFDVLNEKMVMEYMDRIIELNLPPGKLTIDAGWSPMAGKGGAGDWMPDRSSFPDMQRMAQSISDRGFVPGIWFALPLIAPDSDYGMNYPAELGAVTRWGAGGAGAGLYHWPLPCVELENNYREIFKRFIGYGFRKFKLDIYYGPKMLMIGLLRLAYETAKELDPMVEIECHIPDVFGSRWCDVVRSNDVFLTKEQAFTETLLHWSVCRLSSPHKVLNNDYIGGNVPSVTREDYERHIEMFYGGGGHPAVSLLPDRFGHETVSKLRNFLLWYQENRGIMLESRIVEQGWFPPGSMSIPRDGKELHRHEFMK